MQAIIRAVNLIVATLLVSGASCQEKLSMNTYAEDQIVSIEVAKTENGKVTLNIQPIMESAHYLAGARIEDLDSKRQLSLVRCSIGSECTVDAEATVEAGTSNPYQLAVDVKEKPVEILFSNGTSRTVYDPDK